MTTTAVFSPGKCLEGYRLWGRKESDTPEQLNRGLKQQKCTISQVLEFKGPAWVSLGQNQVASGLHSSGSPFRTYFLGGEPGAVSELRSSRGRTQLASTLSLETAGFRVPAPTGPQFMVLFLHPQSRSTQWSPPLPPSL